MSEQDQKRADFIESLTEAAYQSPVLKKYDFADGAAYIVYTNSLEKNQDVIRYICTFPGYYKGASYIYGVSHRDDLVGSADEAHSIFSYFTQDVAENYRESCRQDYLNTSY